MALRTALKKIATPPPPRFARRHYHVSINADRLNETLHKTCEWGQAHRYGDAPTETGMARLTLDENDVEVRHWFADEMTKLGCTVTVDEVGNMFAVRKGTNNARPPIAMGSHLDTQPTGGRYDGILGVMAAVEAVRTLNEKNVVTNSPIAAVNWTNEEGARFPKSLCSSAVWAHLLPKEDVYNLQDLSGDDGTMGNALRKSGFLGRVPCSFESMPLQAHFELHIEQGPILERTNAVIGVVEGAQAYRWTEVTIKGRECHTGTTPFEARADALLAASEIIVASNALAKEHHGLASTDVLTLKPGSVNTCPGEVTFVLDVRHKTDAGKEALMRAIRDEVDAILGRQSTHAFSLEWKTTFDNPAIHFDKRCIASIRSSAEQVLENSEKIQTLISGAGHDSCATSRRCPTAMIFVPSRDGLSHHPKEYTSPEHCALGAQVLLDSVLHFDAAATTAS